MLVDVLVKSAFTGKSVVAFTDEPGNDRVPVGEGLRVGFEHGPEQEGCGAAEDHQHEHEDPDDAELVRSARRVDRVGR